MKKHTLTLGRYVDSEQLDTLLHSREVVRKAHLLNADFSAILPSADRLLLDLRSYILDYRTSDEEIRSFHSDGKHPSLGELRDGLRNSDVTLVDFARTNNLTLYLSGLHREVDYVGELAAAIGNSLNACVTVGAFVSPPYSAYTPVHYDYHDVYALQLIGKKHWKCFDYQGKAEAGLNGYKVDPELLGSAHFEEAIVSGQGIFVPKGVPHQVTSLDLPSVHFSIGIRPTTGEELGAALFTAVWRELSNELLGDTETTSELARRVARELGARNLDASMARLATIALISKATTYKRIRNVYLKGQQTRFHLAPGCLYFRKSDEKHIIVEFPMPLKRDVDIDLASFEPGRLLLPEQATGIFDLIESNPNGFIFSDVTAIYDEQSSHILLTLLTEHGIIAPTSFYHISEN